MTGQGVSSWMVSVDYPTSNADELAQYFKAERDSVTSDWRLVIEKPLDLETINRDFGISLQSISLRLSCTETSSFQFKYNRFMYVDPVSEFPPYFNPENPEFDFYEDAQPGHSLFDLMTVVEDYDVRSSGAEIRHIYANPYTGPERDALEVMDVQQFGQAFLKSIVDYESGDRLFVLNVTVEDQGGLTNSTTVTITVINVNDNPPTFWHRGCRADCGSIGYEAVVSPTQLGQVTDLTPEQIHAQDPDDDPVTFRIVTGSPMGFEQYVSIDPINGSVHLLKPLEDSDFSDIFFLLEVSESFEDNRTRSMDPMHTAISTVHLEVEGRHLRNGSTGAGGASPNSAGGSSSREDTLFICTIVLSGLLLISLTLLIVLLCALKKRTKSHGPSIRSSGATRGEWRPSSMGVIMYSGPNSAHVNNRESKKEDRRINHNYRSENENNVRNSDNLDDVFVTDMHSYYDIQGMMSGTPTLSETHRSEIIPFQDAVTLSRDGSQRASAHPTPLSHSRREGKAETVSSPVDQALSRQNHTQSNTENSNLQSHYLALDLLTSVTPMSNESKTTATLNPPAGYTDTGSVSSMRSFRDVDVISELEEIVAAQRRSDNEKPLSEGKAIGDEGHNQSVTSQNSYHTRTERGNSSVEEDVTSFINAAFEKENAVVPLDQASEEKVTYFPSYANFQGNPFRSSRRLPRLNTASTNPFRESITSNASLLTTPDLSPIYPLDQHPQHTPTVATETITAYL
ncbi:uncharacterized protein LOC106012320 [Aplysia californica]|uniref:Uncharacterized protein LOC106012320 n=1 Tax=Aplysia californica TaxID=6500 RepID=A0ABM1A413_APLCA|nr:uncharacterized protein LOC106012320 [Aplysia californica]